jgi:hypothetical protein
MTPDVWLHPGEPHPAQAAGALLLASVAHLNAALQQQQQQPATAPALERGPPLMNQYYCHAQSKPSRPTIPLEAVLLLIGIATLYPCIHPFAGSQKMDCHCKGLRALGFCCVRAFLEAGAGLWQ